MPIPVGDTNPTVLVALSDVYTHLQVPVANQTSALGAQIQGFIDAATEFVQFQTGPIIPVVCTEVHSGRGPTIVLDQPPLLTVTSVTEYVGPTAYTLTQCELGTPTGAYAFSVDDPQAGIICRRYTGGLAGPFAGGYRNVQVIYTAGQSSVPADVRMAVLEDIRGLFSQTQYGGESSAFGGEITGSGDTWTQGDPINPIGSFPRLAALLEGPTRAPSIA